MAKLKPRQSEADRSPLAEISGRGRDRDRDRDPKKYKPKREVTSAESSGRGRDRVPKYKPTREAPSVESSGRHGPKLLDRKFRNDRGMTPLLNQNSRNDRGMPPGGKFKLSKDTSKESPWRRPLKDRNVLSSLTTVKKKTKNESASKESWHDEKSPKWKKRVTRTNPHDTTTTTSTFRDRKVLSPVKTVKKKVKYNTDTKESSLEDPPKRKKRVIRIDPHDISNKRLDDSPALSPDGVEEKKGAQNESELSQNAQFRAIEPTPSILSFVEDNLLGRRRSIELKRAGYNIDLSVPLDNIPLSTSSDRERIEETVFRNKLTFFAAAKVSSSFPPPDAPEIAFAGRSNVGKSSLLNALTRQWGVVRTSDKPGLTQTINFFQLGPKLRLVDLPGYGFAYAKEEVKDAWEELVKEYVSTRDGLKQVCLLVDTKWGMKPRDQELINLMERSQTKYQIVLTKTDTVFPIDVARRAWQIEDTLKVNKSIVHPVMMVSAKSGAGIRTLRTVLAKVARFAKI